MIELKKIKKIFKDEVILEDLSFIFEDGKIYTIFGDSGIGKTTLLRIIAGLEKTDSGSVYIDGTLCTDKAIIIEPDKRKTGFVFQQPSLWPHLTVKKNIQFGFPKKKDRKEIKDEYDNLINELKIREIQNKYPFEISHGQAKRVSIARTLITNRKHILMDEAMANLDKDLREKVIKTVLNHIKEKNSTLINITHDKNEFDGWGDIILQINDKILTFC
jgi:ABC-type sugar transport system ATPase subunit